jgi:hypothetical protein
MVRPFKAIPYIINFIQYKAVVIQYMVVVIPYKAIIIPYKATISPYKVIVNPCIIINCYSLLISFIICFVGKYHWEIINNPSFTGGINNYCILISYFIDFNPYF